MPCSNAYGHAVDIHKTQPHPAAAHLLQDIGELTVSSQLAGPGRVLVYSWRPLKNIRVPAP